ncbi:zinc finger, CCHC-type containing protein [Tanacetum coccineum]
MDVKTAFLNGESEEVYMEQPEDDMLIFGTDLEQVQMTKKLLFENFDMKDLGEADVILGIKNLQKENRMMLTQSHYIEKILKRFDSFGCLSFSTPLETAYVVGRLSRHTSSPGKEY